jgi:hypothetical protein
VLWRAGDDNSGSVCILDGRNRMAALARLGVTFPPPGELEVEFPDGHTEIVFSWCHTTDPARYVISANIRRRHLTKKQQAELILLTIQAGQNDVANVARSFNPINGKRGGSSKDPVLHKAIEEAKKLDISPKTMHRALAQVRGGAKVRKSKRTDGATTRAATSDGSALETSAPLTAGAASKKIRAILQHMEAAVQQAVKKWPQGNSLLALVAWLHAQADQLEKGEEATPATNARGPMLRSSESADDVNDGRG